MQIKATGFSDRRNFEWRDFEWRDFERQVFDKTLLLDIFEFLRQNCKIFHPKNPKKSYYWIFVPNNVEFRAQEFHNRHVTSTSLQHVKHQKWTWRNMYTNLDNRCVSYKNFFLETKIALLLESDNNYHH